MKDTENIVQLFFDSANEFPNKACIIEEENSISYKELLFEVETTAAYFISKGIKFGDRVLVFVPMSIDLYRILLALFSIGATAVFLDEWVSLKRLELCAKIANCNGFIGITKSHILRLFSKSIRRIPVKLKIGGRSEKATLLPKKVTNELPALITFTTGSTGVPKAAIRTHSFLAIQFEILKEKVGSSHHDIEITNLPIVLFINLGIGATTVICKFSPKKAAKFNYLKLIKSIDSLKVTRVVFSPFLLNEYCHSLKENQLSNNSIIQIFTGGGPVFPKEAQLIINQFPDLKAEVIFGSTEAEPMSSISMKDLAIRNVRVDNGLSVGTAHHEAEIKIIEICDSPLQEVIEIPNDQIGEIIVSGRHVLANYFNNPEAFKRNKILVEGKIYHRTGDSGFLNSQNELFLTGRCQAIIRNELNNYYPFIVEYELAEIEGVEVGTLIQQNNKLLLVIEHSRNTNRSRESIEIELDKSFPNVEGIIWKKIPRDPRHHSKIDSEKLKLQILKK